MKEIEDTSKKEKKINYFKDVFKRKNTLSGETYVEINSFVGECSGFLGLKREETLITETNCLFLVMNTNLAKKL